jgi:glucose/arabinose dehydrogenase
LILLACAPSGARRESAQSGSASASAPSAPTAQVDVSLDTVAKGLEVPWALAFAPDGRIFVTERPGRVRVIVNGALRQQPWATIPVNAQGEAGLMGIALAPDFATSRRVYVVGSFVGSRGLVNRVLVLRDSNGVGVDSKVLVDNIPSASNHAGDAIAFGPDGMLYVATGDAREPSVAQNPSSLGGKILRYTADGGIPSDNPTPGSPVFALGVRNVQGLAWDGATGQLFATEHGPSGFPNERFRHDNDELNAIRRGGNYGWPAVAGIGGESRYIDPIAAWTPGIAPSGLASYWGDEIREWKGNLFVGALRGAQLRRIVIARDSAAPTGWRVVDQLPMFANELGRIRAVAMGPDGRLYFTTSNRDGRGSPSRSDDRIFRLVRRQ